MNTAATLLLFTTIAVGVVISKPLSEAEHEKSKKLIDECAESTGVDKEVIEKAWKGEFVDDEALKEGMLCFSHKLDVINDDGHINAEKLTEHLTALLEEDEHVDEIVTKCTVEKDSPKETALELVKCLHGEIHKD